ncbi:MAG: aldo/keto reductase [Verrucomicrobiales bacterium]
MVHKVMLSPDGPKVSEIVYGTWRLLEGDPSPTTDALIERFEWCEELGLSTLDTAEIYGSYQVEAAIGEVFKARPSWRDSFEIITKCGIDVPSEEKGDASIAHYNATAANLRLCAEKSLKLLHTDHLDVLLVHRPDWLTSADETASAIENSSTTVWSCMWAFRIIPATSGTAQFPAGSSGGDQPGGGQPSPYGCVG